jgi:transcriptional regulator with XRE-family HTH domain
MNDRDEGIPVTASALAMPDLDIDAEEFGRRFKAARIAAGWPSGHAASKALGMTWGGYNRLEGGKQVPSFARLLTIVRVLGLDPKILAPEWFKPRRGR